MSDERPSDVLGSLPHTRPHRRSDKRATRPEKGKPAAAVTPEAVDAVKAAVAAGEAVVAPKPKPPAAAAEAQPKAAKPKPKPRPAAKPKPPAAVKPSVATKSPAADQAAGRHQAAGRRQARGCGAGQDRGAPGQTSQVTSQRCARHGGSGRRRAGRDRPHRQRPGDPARGLPAAASLVARLISGFGWPAKWA